MVGADISAIHTCHDVKRQNPRMVAVNNSAIHTRHDVKWQNLLESGEIRHLESGEINQ